MKSWLAKNDVERYSTHNEKNLLLLKYLLEPVRIKFINKLDDIFNKYNNTYHRTIKMKPVNVKLTTYSDSRK